MIDWWLGTSTLLLGSVGRQLGMLHTYFIQVGRRVFYFSDECGYFSALYILIRMMM
jgi:hypothetical protein